MEKGEAKKPARFSTRTKVAAGVLAAAAGVTGAWNVMNDKGPKPKVPYTIPGPEQIQGPGAGGNEETTPEPTPTMTPEIIDHERFENTPEDVKRIEEGSNPQQKQPQQEPNIDTGGMRIERDK